MSQWKGWYKSESLFWRRGVGAKFLKSRRAAIRALDLAGLGAGRAGLDSDEMYPVFTSQVTSSNRGSHVKAVANLIGREIGIRRQKTQVAPQPDSSPQQSCSHQIIRERESTLP